MRIHPPVFAGLGLVAMALCSCVCKPPPATGTATGPGVTPAPPPSGDRTPMIAPDDPNYSRVEGTTFANACQTDAECFTGGCSSEVCSAQQGVSSTCIAPADGWPNAGGSCGCVSGQCVWYTTAGTTPAPGTTGTTTDPGTTGTTDPGTTTTDPGTTNPDPATSTGGQTQPCTAAGTCNTGLSCLTYYGIAGASGPKFTSCEIPCGQGKPACPTGQMCATIADGPGTVCRPKK